jgi:hypothetical protein
MMGSMWTLYGCHLLKLIIKFHVPLNFSDTSYDFVFWSNSSMRRRKNFRFVSWSQQFSLTTSYIGKIEFGVLDRIGL